MRPPSILSLLVLVGCAAPDEPSPADSATPVADTDTDTETDLTGVAQKGPFFAGARVTVYELDARFAQTGRSFFSTVDSEDGRWTVRGVRVAEPQVLVSVDGDYLDEATCTARSGALSVLQDIRAGTDVGINLIAHIQRPRIEALIRAGTPFADAARQAHAEFSTSLGLPAPTGPAALLDLYGAGIHNGLLLALSAGADHLTEPGAPAAPLSEALQRLADDFEDGTLTAGSRAAIDHAVTMSGALDCQALLDIAACLEARAPGARLDLGAVQDAADAVLGTTRTDTCGDADRDGVPTLQDCDDNDPLLGALPCPWDCEADEPEPVDTITQGGAWTSWSTPAETVTFDVQTSIVDQTYEFPLIVNVGFIIDSIGVVARVNADALVDASMTATRSLSWGDGITTMPGEVVHTLDATLGGGTAALTSLLDVEVDVEIGVFGSLFTFSLASPTATLASAPIAFDTLLLPTQSPHQVRVEAPPAGVTVPMSFDRFDLGVLGVSIGVAITATPETFATIRGTSLTVAHDGQVSSHTGTPASAVLTLSENTGAVDLSTEHAHDVTTEIGYRLVGSGGLTVSILGSDIPITVSFFNQYVNLFSGVDQFVTQGAPSQPAIPKIEAPTALDFGCIEPDTTDIELLTVANPSAVDLEVAPGIDGAGLFSVDTTPFVVPAGGTATVSVTAAPVNDGAYAADLVLSSSDPFEPVVRVALTAEGCCP